MSKQYDPFIAGSIAGLVASLVESPIDLVSASLHDSDFKRQINKIGTSICNSACKIVVVSE